MKLPELKLHEKDKRRKRGLRQEPANPFPSGHAICRQTSSPSAEDLRRHQPGQFVLSDTRCCPGVLGVFFSCLKAGKHLTCLPTPSFKGPDDKSKFDSINDSLGNQ